MSNIPSISFTTVQDIEDLKYELTHLLEPIKLSLDRLSGGDTQAVSVVEFRRGILSSGERVASEIPSSGSPPVAAPEGAVSPVSVGLSAEEVQAIIAEAEVNLAPLFESLNSSIDSTLNTLNAHTGAISELESTYGSTLAASQSAAAAIIAEANALLSEQAAADSEAAAISASISAQAAADAAQTALESGVAMDDTGGVSYGFTTTVEGWTATNANITWQAEGSVDLEATGADPDMRSPSGLTIDGAVAKQIVARIKRTTGTSWEGTAYYTTSGHGFSDSYKKTLSEPSGLDADWVTLEWDMDDLTAGGTDWEDNTITQIRLDLGSDATTDFDVTFVGVGNSVTSLAEAAAESASAALASAGTASSEAAAATTARIAAEAAQTAAEGAESDAVVAQAAAESARDESVTAQSSAEGAEANALSSASLAAASEAAAANSETNATNSASAASGFASQASTSAGEAGSAASAAQTAQVLAESAEADAEGFASAASTSASTASTASGDAAISAGAADSFASAASTSATNASTSESNASTFASNASISADDAASSESTASTAATTASNAATTAQTAASNASSSESAASISATAAALWGDTSNRVNPLRTIEDRSGWGGTFVGDADQPSLATFAGRTKTMWDHDFVPAHIEWAIFTDGWEIPQDAIFRVTGSFGCNRTGANIGISVESSSDNVTWTSGGIRIRNQAQHLATESDIVRIIRTNKNHNVNVWYDFEVYIAGPSNDLGKFPGGLINGEPIFPTYDAWGNNNDGVRVFGKFVRLRLELLELSDTGRAYFSDIYAQRIDDSTSIAIQEESAVRITKDGLTEGEYTVKIETLADGNDYIAGFGIAVQNGESGPTSQALFNVDTFAVTHPDVSGAEMFPFLIDSGLVLIDALRVSDLRSTNYVPGVDGWALDRNGNFEANDGLFRGNLDVGSITSLEVADASISRTVQAFHDYDQQGLIELQVSSWTDIFGAVPITTPVTGQILENTRIVVDFWVQIVESGSLQHVNILEGDPVTEVRITGSGGGQIVRQRLYSGVNPSWTFTPAGGLTTVRIEVRTFITAGGGVSYAIRDAGMTLNGFYR